MEKTINELKALAYDLIISRESISMELNKLNQEIAKRETDGL